LQKIFDWFVYTIKEEIALKTIQKSIAILILLSTFLLLNCVKFKENPLDPTTPTGFLLSLNLSYTPDKILLFPTTQGGQYDNGKYQGNIKETYPSAREAIDTICRNEFNNVKATYPGNYEYMQNVRGFISIDATDSISNYPNLYNVPTNVPIMGPNPNNTNRLVANDWADLWSADGGVSYIRNTLQNAIGLSGPWWSGSNFNGNIDPYGYHCNNWTNNDNSVLGISGNNIATDGSWIRNASQYCEQYNYLLCIAW
jgi:hypothetical protein